MRSAQPVLTGPTRADCSNTSDSPCDSGCISAAASARLSTVRSPRPAPARQCGLSRSRSPLVAAPPGEHERRQIVEQTASRRPPTPGPARRRGDLGDHVAHQLQRSPSADRPIARHATAGSTEPQGCPPPNARPSRRSAARAIASRASRVLPTPQNRRSRYHGRPVRAERIGDDFEFLGATRQRPGPHSRMLKSCLLYARQLFSLASQLSASCGAPAEKIFFFFFFFFFFIKKNHRLSAARRRVSPRPPATTCPGLPARCAGSRTRPRRRRRRFSTAAPANALRAAAATLPRRYRASWCGIDIHCRSRSTHRIR